MITVEDVPVNRFRKHNDLRFAGHKGCRIHIVHKKLRCDKFGLWANNGGWSNLRTNNLNYAELRYCTARFNHRSGDAQIDFNSGGKARIFPNYFERKPKFDLFFVYNTISHLVHLDTYRKNPSTSAMKRLFGGHGGCYRRFRGPPIEEETIDQGSGADCGQIELKLGSANNFIRGLSHALLRDKVVFIALAGFLLIPVGTFGLFWLFEDSNRHRKFWGGSIALTILPLALFLIWLGIGS